MQTILSQDITDQIIQLVIALVTGGGLAALVLALANARKLSREGTTAAWQTTVQGLQGEVQRLNLAVLDLTKENNLLHDADNNARLTGLRLRVDVDQMRSENLALRELNARQQAEINALKDLNSGQQQEINELREELRRFRRQRTKDQPDA